MSLFGMIKEKLFGSNPDEETEKQIWEGDPYVMIPENDGRKNFHRYRTPRGGSNCGAIDSMAESGGTMRESTAREKGYSECGNCERWEA